MENVRLRTDGKEVDTENFEIWDISNPDDLIKCVYTITPTSQVNQQAWIQDIQRAMKDKGRFILFFTCRISIVVYCCENFKHRNARRHCHNVQ